MSKFKVEVSKPNSNEWYGNCFPETFKAECEEEAIDMARDIIDKCFDCTADEYMYRAIAC